MKSLPPSSSTFSTICFTPKSMVSTGMDARFDDARVADHVGVGEVHDDQVVVLQRGA